MARLFTEDWDVADGSWPSIWNSRYTLDSTTPGAVTVDGNRGKLTTPFGTGWGYSTEIADTSVPGLGDTYDLTVDFTTDGTMGGDDWFITVYLNSDGVSQDPSAVVDPQHGILFWFGWSVGDVRAYTQFGQGTPSGDYTGAMNILPDGFYTPGAPYKMRVRREGFVVQGWVWPAGEAQPVTPSSTYTFDGTDPFDGSYIGLGATNGAQDLVFTTYWDNLVIGSTVASEDWTAADGSPWPAQWRTDFRVNGGDVGSFDVAGNRGRAIARSNYSASMAYLVDMPAMADTDATVSVTLGDEPEFYFGMSICSDGVLFAPGSTLYATNAYFLELGPIYGPSDGPYIWGARVLDGVTNGLTQPWNEPSNYVGTAKDYPLVRGVPYKLRMQRTGTTVRMKFWLASDPEPTTWNFSWVEDPAHMPPPGRIMLSMGGGDSQGGTVYVDDLVVNGTVIPVPTVQGYVGGKAVRKAYLGTQALTSLYLG